MYGPEHYREAERLLILGHNMKDQLREQQGQARADFIIARAQVHATLSLAAATVEHRDTFAGADGSSTTYIATDTAWNQAFADDHKGEGEVGE
jgi:hypothetical protein